MTVLQGLLKFGMRRRKLKINVARGIPDLYAVGQRANIIWLRQELDLLVRRADELGVPQIGDAALLAWDTGLRLQDLITVNMTHVRPSEIVKKARKRSRGRRRFAVIPRTPSLDETLERLARRPHRQGVSTLLVNPRGEPWRDFNLDIGFRELRKACGIVHIDPTTGLPQSKHLHDMRGTFATRLVTQTDLTDAEIAQIMAWAPDYVAQVRRI